MFSNGARLRLVSEGTRRCVASATFSAPLSATAVTSPIARSSSSAASGHRSFGTSTSSTSSRDPTRRSLISGSVSLSGHLTSNAASISQHGCAIRSVVPQRQSLTPSLGCTPGGAPYPAQERLRSQPQRRCIAVVAEPTPNPESIMFYPQGQDVLGNAAKTKTFNDKASATKSLLATALFKIHGVSQIMLAARHVTVTKQPDLDWELVRPNIELVMSQFFAAGLEVMDPRDVEYFGDGQSRMPNPVADGAQVPEKGSDPEAFEQELLQLLEERVQPFVQQDGGDVEYVKTEDDVVYLRMMGACSGCPKSGITLNIQIKQLIQHYFPHIVDVREFVDPNEEEIPRGH